MYLLFFANLKETITSGEDSLTHDTLCTLLRMTRPIQTKSVSIRLVDYVVTRRGSLYILCSQTFTKTMAAAAAVGFSTAESCSLRDLPSVKSVLSLGGTITSRSRQRGYKYFVQGYVHGIRFNLSGQDVVIKAKCYRSMKKNHKEHEITLNLHKPTAVFSHAWCSCTAG